MTRKLRHLKGLIPFVALPLFWGCQETPLEVVDRGSNPSVAGGIEDSELVLMVLPEIANLGVGDRLELETLWWDGDDTYQDAVMDARWVSDYPDIASVTQDGLVQALAKGTVSIWARGDGGEAEAIIRVR
jgi:hypothetical protein